MFLMILFFKILHMSFLHSFGHALGIYSLIEVKSKRNVTIWCWDNYVKWHFFFDFGFSVNFLNSCVSQFFSTLSYVVLAGGWHSQYDIKTCMFLLYHCNQ